MPYINLVEKVSRKDITILNEEKDKNLLVIDCGIKNNIIKLLSFDITLTIVPFDYKINSDNYDGIFISNGPGDPKSVLKQLKV